MNFRRLSPPMHSLGSPATEPATTLGQLKPYAGSWLSYAADAVEVRDYEGNTIAQPVSDQWVVDSFFSLGLLPQLDVGLVLPVAVHSVGDPPSDWGADGNAVSAPALGDLAIKAKVGLLAPTPDAAGFGLAALASLNTPTGDPDSYISDGAPSGDAKLLATLDSGIVSLRAAGGVYWRSDARTFVGERFGSSLTWGASVAVHPQPEARVRLSATADLRGDIAFEKEFATEPGSPILAGLFGRCRVGDWGVFLGSELGLSAAVGNPRYRPIVGIEWSTSVADHDRDGIEDGLDACVGEPEDPDGIQDADGCPDLDADGDGVPDQLDKCSPASGQAAIPSHVEDRDGFRDEDGCADLDNDGDSVEDSADACPSEPGEAGASATRRGCPRQNVDTDADGVAAGDACEGQPEDKDGFQDADGCPDLDNDGDRVPDAEDECPSEPGEASGESPSGCPDPDSDQDTYLRGEDACPDSPEDFDGVEDTDGCKDDAPGQELVQFETVQGSALVKFSRPTVVLVGETGGVHFDVHTSASLRALAQYLIQNPSFFAEVSAPSTMPVAEATTLTLAFVEQLNRLARRPNAARTTSLKAHAPRGPEGWRVVMRVGSDHE